MQAGGEPYRARIGDSTDGPGAHCSPRFTFELLLNSLRHLGAASVRIVRSLLVALCAVCIAGVVTAPVQAEIYATTDDGRRVLLGDDQVWEYVDDVESTESEPESGDHVVLEVTEFEDVGHGCLVRLKVTNNQGHMIKSLVPQFHALLSGDVLYEKLFMAFSWVKPTRDQSKAITYSGLACTDIARIKVSGADRCEMGDLTKHSAEKGECLKRIQVRPSELVSISK